MEMAGRFVTLQQYWSSRTRLARISLAVIASPKIGAKGTPLPLLYLIVDFASGRMAHSGPWRCTTSSRRCSAV